MRRAVALAAVAAVLLANAGFWAWAAPYPDTAVYRYAHTVRWYNPRLTWGQAYWVAIQILRWSLAFGVDPRLVMAVIAVESSFRHNAVSYRGAIGFGQLMPYTAAAMGVNPYDPLQNIYGTARKLRELLEATNWRLDLALAAYNAGLAAVRRHGGIPPYRETQWYVYKVIVLYSYFRSHPAWKVW
jgi:soluble lytic murein transglycosylase-like protein